MQKRIIITLASLIAVIGVLGLINAQIGQQPPSQAVSKCLASSLIPQTSSILNGNVKNFFAGCSEKLTLKCDSKKQCNSTRENGEIVARISIENGKLRISV